MKNLNAFTLSEVLITLGIIGIVAAMTLPTVINKYRDKQILTQFNHSVSLFSQGFITMANDNGGKLTNIMEAGPYNDFRHLKEDFYKQYFKIQKMCIPYGSFAECIPNKYKALDKTTENSEFCGTYQQVGILSTGILFCLGMPNGRDEGWEDRFTLSVDINGIKGPNVLGIDAFRFFIKNNGVVTYYGTPDAGSCNINIKGNSRNGHRCSEWIIKHQNLDYLYKAYPNGAPEWQ